MKLYKLVVPKLNKYRELCNFTDDELEYFNLKADKVSNTDIADHMNISTSMVSKLASQVKEKITTIDEYLCNNHVL